MPLSSILKVVTNRRRAVAGLAAAAAIAPIKKAAAEPLSSEAFRYTTFFNFKPDTPEHIRKEYERRWIAFMIACPQAQSPELNTPLRGSPPKPGFQYFSTIVFRNAADCEVYLNHPLHVSLHHELILPYADMPGVSGGRYSYRPCRDHWARD